MIRREKLAIACLMLSLVAGLVGLSSCGGGGGGGSRGSGDEVIITPPGNQAPVIEQALEDVVLPLPSGQSRWESAPLGTFFSDPEGETLEFSAQVEDSSDISVEISNTDTLILHVQNAATATITVTAQDPGGFTATQDFTVTVGDGSAPPTDRHSDTLAAATEIVVGRTVEGYINSAQDVDFFSFTPPGSGIYLISLDSDFSGVELALLDESGNVIASDQTQSYIVLAMVASVGLGVIAILNKDANLLQDKMGRTQEEIIADFVSLGLDTFFSYRRAQKSLVRVLCVRGDCVPGNHAVRYAIEVTKSILSQKAHDLVFSEFQPGEACQAQVTFNEQGFFAPSRYVSTQFGTSRYSGACGNGRANGQGTYTASDTGRSLTYTGAWVDGEPRGSGDWRISDSNFGTLHYNGEWQSGQPNGQGTGIIEFNNGNDWRYTGAWVRGNPHGQGTWSALTNGDRYHYVGEFSNGLQHGQGTETNTYANGDRERLVGEFRFDVIWNGTSTWNGFSCRVVNGMEQC